ncbi:hypothetical protein [Chryseobacterium arachidis]|nr:hypothetical protein [Chryseobacterium arachidis]
MSNLKSVYDYRNLEHYKRKFIRTGRVLECAYDEFKRAREMSCQNAKLIEKKYPFILDEIKKTAKDHPNYLDLNMFWIEKKNDTKDDENFNLSAEDEKVFEKWKSQKNHSYFSAVIISSVIDDHNEYVQLTITFPKEVIKKTFKLSYKYDWSFKQL